MDTRERILDVALHAFGSRGYEATSLDSIAAELGVRKQSVLYWYTSKEALLEAVIDDAAAALSAEIERSLVKSSESFGRIEAVVRALFAVATRRPELLGLLRELSRLGPPASTRFTEAVESLKLRASRFFASEMDKGRFRRSDPSLTLMATYSIVVGMATDVDVMRAFGIEPTTRSAARRRKAVLDFLRSALVK
ncbi:MAG: TetR/AcrR family transcriptional regulator [Acidimicrobiia bacterium]